MMGQESNDLEQVKECRKTLANVYKSQLNADANTSIINSINSAIMNIQSIISSLEGKKP